MTIDLKAWKAETIRDLTINHGLSQDVALQMQVVAQNALMRTNGGASHYIPARPRTDKQSIKAEFAAGVRIETIARRRGLTHVRIRQILLE